MTIQVKAVKQYTFFWFLKVFSILQCKLIWNFLLIFNFGHLGSEKFKEHMFFQDLDTYIHRSGRTGRAGRSGISIIFYKPNQQAQLHAVEKRAVSRTIVTDVENGFTVLGIFYAIFQ